MYYMSMDDVLTSKANQIYLWLLDEFHAGRIGVAERLPSENELCVRFAVSRPQARLALARLAHEGRIRTIRGKGTYRLDSDRNGNKDIAVVLPNLDSYIYPEIVSSASTTLRQRGYQALFDCSDSDPQTELHILERLLERKPAGIIISPLQEVPGGGSKSLQLLKQIRLAGTALLLLDNVLGETAFSSIVMDDYGAGIAAANFLISRGHARVAVCWSPGHAPFNVRAKGFLDEAARQLGAEGERQRDGRREWWLESRGELRTGDWGKAIEGFFSMQQRPTAIFCVNDLLALSVRDTARSLGIQIPQDLSLIGFDDSPIARIPEIGLTSFVYPSGLIGKKAANLLVDSIEAGPPASRNSVVMESVLTERTTVASPPD